MSIESFKTGIFISLWLISWFFFLVGNTQLALFLAANLIIWAVIELMFMLLAIVKTYNTILRDLKGKDGK